MQQIQEWKEAIDLKIIEDHLNIFQYFKNFKVSCG